MNAARGVAPDSAAQDLAVERPTEPGAEQGAGEIEGGAGVEAAPERAAAHSPRSSRPAVIGPRRGSRHGPQMNTVGRG